MSYQDIEFMIDSETLKYQQSLQGASFTPSWLKQEQEPCEINLKFAFDVSVAIKAEENSQTFKPTSNMEFQDFWEFDGSQKGSTKPSQNDFPNIQTELCQKPIRQKKAIAKSKRPHPTKNFLVNFKRFHFDMIKDRMGNLIYSDHELQRISGGTGINMRDYQYLYNIEALRPIFKAAFQKKEIYRYLMMSRVKSQLKKIYIGKLGVFEKAFNQRVFTHVN